MKNTRRIKNAPKIYLFIFEDTRSRDEPYYIMKVVVTGGSGFIGSNLAVELVKCHKATVIDDL
jgi:hypothetical protein